jgi:hypothetical protein
MIEEIHETWNSTWIIVTTLWKKYSIVCLMLFYMLSVLDVGCEFVDGEIECQQRFHQQALECWEIHSPKFATFHG